MDSHGRKVAVIDNGTTHTKCGHADTNFPSHIFPSVVGRPTILSSENEALVVGEKCATLREALSISRPMDNGIVTNWEDMRHIWDYSFGPTKLDVDPKECKLLLTEPHLNPIRNRERMFQVMFEQYGFDSLYIARQAVLTLYAQGMMTGVVVDIGDAVTHICPIYEGYPLNHLVRRLDVAGRHITKYLMQLLRKRGNALDEATDFDSIGEMKEMFCYVARDVEEERKAALETMSSFKRHHILPDGRPIQLDVERFEASEVLFQPHLLDLEAGSLSLLLFNCIQSAALDTRLDLYQHIVLSGGTTMLPGLAIRLEHDIKELYLQRVLKGNVEGLQKFKIWVDAPVGRKYSVFAGGAFLAHIMRDRDEDFWISKADYDEEGMARCMEKLRGTR